MGRRIYLDHNATTALRPGARAAMLAAMELCGNASSIHAEGRAARASIEAAREALGRFVGTLPRRVIFTSGATEALNLILQPGLSHSTSLTVDYDVLLVSGGEHASVLFGHRFPAGRIETIGLTATGELDLEALAAVLRRHAGYRIMLAVQAANNETGVVQPIAEAAALLRAASADTFFVCDAAQAAGKIACTFDVLPVDALIFSAHKFGGPAGIGALCLREDVVATTPLLRGGGQEFRQRAGTQALIAIAGLAGALAEMQDRFVDECAALVRLRDTLEREMRAIVADLHIFGENALRLPNTSAFALPGVEAQVLLMFLDVEGVAVSSGSACSSGKVKTSHVLESMCVDPSLAGGAVRLSLGWNSQEEDCPLILQAFAKAARTIKGRQIKSAA